MRARVANPLRVESGGMWACCRDVGGGVGVVGLIVFIIILGRFGLFAGHDASALLVCRSGCGGSSKLQGKRKGGGWAHEKQNGTRRVRGTKPREHGEEERKRPKKGPLPLHKTTHE